MKKINIFFIIALLAQINLYSQQELSLHFMQELGQSKRVNPAVDHPYNIHVGLPSPGFSFFNSAFSLNEIFTKNNTTWVLNPESALTNLKTDRNDVRFSSNLETLSVGFNIGKFQFSLFHNVNVDAGLMFPKALLDVAWHGNTYYLGETVNIAPSIDLMTYHEFGAGVSFNLLENLRVGANLKYLQGMVAIETQHSMLNFHTAPTYYQLSVESDIYFRSSGFAPDFYKSSNEDIFPSSNNVTFLFNANRGVGLDLGAIYQLNDKLKLSFSALDLGAILWKSSVYNHRSNGNFTFDGIEVNPFRSDSQVELGEVIDTLGANLEFNSDDEIFSTFLIPKFYLSGCYNLGEGLNAGALFYSDIYKGRFNPALALNIRKRFGKIFHLGAMVGMHARSRPNIGLNSSVLLGPVQLYFVTDNLPSVISLSNGRNTSVRFGMNLVFNSKTAEEKQMEEIQNSAQPANSSNKSEKQNLVPKFYNPWLAKAPLAPAPNQQ